MDRCRVPRGQCSLLVRGNAARQDVLRGIDVRILCVAAGHTGKDALARSVLGRDVPTLVALLARVRGVDRDHLNVLRTLHLITGHGALVFPGERDHGKPMSNNTILKALERMGYKGRMTGHGFRGVASTLLHEMGFDHQHIELQLAHQQRDEVSAAYNHALYLKQRARMMQHWADYLDTCTTGKVIAGKFGKTVKTA